MKGFKLFLVLALRKPCQSASLKRMVISLSTAGVRYIAKFLPCCTLIAVSLAFSLCCLKSKSAGSFGVCVSVEEKQLKDVASVISLR